LPPAFAFIFAVCAAFACHYFLFFSSRRAIATIISAASFAFAAAISIFRWLRRRFRHAAFHILMLFADARVADDIFIDAIDARR
jgi:hypothetical protein